MSKKCYINEDIDEIRKEGYEIFGKSGLIRGIIPIYDFRDQDFIKEKAAESLKTAKVNLEDCVGFALFTRHGEEVIKISLEDQDHYGEVWALDILNYEVDDNAHYTEVWALREIKVVLPEEAQSLKTK